MISSKVSKVEMKDVVMDVAMEPLAFVARGTEEAALAFT
jgi:hypothetical protein